MITLENIVLLPSKIQEKPEKTLVINKRISGLKYVHTRNVSRNFSISVEKIDNSTKARLDELLSKDFVKFTKEGLKIYVIVNINYENEYKIQGEFFRDAVIELTEVAK